MELMEMCLIAVQRIAKELLMDNQEAKGTELSESLQQCKHRFFKPIFGTKIANLSQSELDENEEKVLGDDMSYKSNNSIISFFNESFINFFKKRN